MHKNILSLAVAGAAIMLSAACSHNTHRDPAPVDTSALQDSLQSIADSYPAEIGIAVIIDSHDTVVVNNDNRYPLMSVFKLHQAIATARVLDAERIPIDSVINIPRSELNASTWSPMLKEIADDTLRLSFRQLLAYSLEKSDNNASNYLFENILPPDGVDNLIAEIIPREDFQIRFSEDMMGQDHQIAYENKTSPLSAASLIDRLYNDSTVAEAPYSDLIRADLEACATGNDRIPSPLINRKGIVIAHKTGSGFRDNGILIAHNDVAYIRLSSPERHYSLAVFIKDFSGDETEASAIIARISKMVYDFLSK